MALVTAATIAGTALGAMYLEGKYFLSKDFHQWRRERIGAAAWAEAVKSNRQSLYYHFENSAKKRPNEECIWSREGCYTWCQAYDRVHQYGQFFLKKGIMPKDYVAVYMMNSPDFVFIWLALMAVGAAPSMINYNLSGDALVHVLKVSGAKLLLVDDEPAFVKRIVERKGGIEGLGMEVFLMGDAAKSQIYSSKPEIVPNVHRDGVRGNWPMVMFFTSGTTGMPKGVSFIVERAFQVGVVNKPFAIPADRVNGFTLTKDDDRFYNCMPMYHGTGGIMAVTMMMTGITLCIGKRFSTSKFWSEVHDSRATWITYVGETARYLLAAPPSPLDKDHHVRAMYGNGLRPDIWNKFRERFNIPMVVEFFGSSEGVLALRNDCRGEYLEHAVGHHGGYSRYRYQNTLVPVLIDGETGALMRDTKTGFAYRQSYETGGEIIVKIPSMAAFSGYHDDEAATMMKYERDVFEKGDLYYRTGDALRRDQDGRWFFLDRLGDTFRWKGENVSTAEVSEVLGKYPGVVEANVYGVSLPSHDGRAGCAAIYLDPTLKGTFDFAGLLKHAKRHLPRYAVPLFLRLVKEMAPMHNNKQNKVPLRNQGVDPTRVHVDDRILWIPDNGKGDTYVTFHPDHWEDLKLGKAML